MLRAGRPVVFYVHPREIDPDHPRLDMGLLRRFKSYVNLDTTEEKLRKILSTFEFTTFAEFLSEETRWRKHPDVDQRLVDEDEVLRMPLNIDRRTGTAR